MAEQYQRRLDGEADERLSKTTKELLLNYLADNPLDDGVSTPSEIMEWNRKAWSYCIAREGPMILACEKIAGVYPVRGVHPDTDWWSILIQDALYECPQPESFARASRSVRNGIATSAIAKNRRDYRLGLPASNAEAKFLRSLKTRMPTVNWLVNCPVEEARTTPDFHSRELLLAIDLDSHAIHIKDDAFVKDRISCRAMQEAGYMHLRFAEVEYLKGEKEVLDQIERIVKKRIARLASGNGGRVDIGV